jgi:hypothetical protein
VKLDAQIDALERLSVLDAELLELEKELGREREALSAKKEQLQGLAERLSRDETQITDMERVRNELILELRQMGAQIERSREKLSRCRTEREANAAQRELEELRKLFRDRELEIEKLQGLAEQARTGMETVRVDRDKIHAELGASESTVTTRLGEVERQLETKRAERETALRKVPTVLYRRYEQIRKRRGTAIANTLDGTCGACHMLLTPILFHKLMRGEDFDQCPSCNRIIYYRPLPGAADRPTSGP